MPNFGFVGITSGNFHATGRRENLGTTFGRPAPLKIWFSKNVQNSARFPTIFDFDRKCHRNVSTGRKSEK